MSFPRLLPAILILALSALSEAAEPLYQQFRPVSSLPWAAPGAGWEQVIRRLYREPNKMVRATLLDEYLQTVPASDFGRVFDLCLQLEQDDSPNDLLEQLLHAWGRIDAAAAWTKCQALYEVIVKQEPLDVDSWGTGIAILNPKAVTASSFWPKSDNFARAFSEGVTESGLPQPEKERYLALQKARSEAWSRASDEVWHKTPQRGEFFPPQVLTPEPAPELTPEQIAEQTSQQEKEAETARLEKARRAFLLEILAYPPPQIQARLAVAPSELRDDAILARALVRWMDGQASRGPEIVEAILALSDPHGDLRENAKFEPIPIEFLIEWALLDGPGFEKWALVEKDGEKDGRPGLKNKSLAVVHAIAARDDADDDRKWEWIYDTEDPGADLQEKNPAVFYWAQIDPENALPWIWSHGGVRTYAAAADSAVYDFPDRSANVFRAIFAAFDHYVVPIPDDPLYMIMEQWSDTDAASCARYGTLWNLRTRLFSKKRMIRLWTGYENPVDGASDDRHFGSLRMWALRQPEQMRKWIRTESLDDDVRQALLWLVDHAAGGFNLRTDASAPMPLKNPSGAKRE